MSGVLRVFPARIELIRLLSVEKILLRSVRGRSAVDMLAASQPGHLLDRDLVACGFRVERRILNALLFPRLFSDLLCVLLLIVVAVGVLLATGGRAELRG